MVENPIDYTGRDTCRGRQQHSRRSASLPQGGSRPFSQSTTPHEELLRWETPLHRVSCGRLCVAQTPAISPIDIDVSSIASVNSLKPHIHNVFHVSLFKPHQENCSQHQLNLLNSTRAGQFKSTTCDLSRSVVQGVALVTRPVEGRRHRHREERIDGIQRGVTTILRTSLFWRKRGML